MNGLEVTPEALNRIADTMRSSTASLNQAAKTPVSDVNAGKSTPAIHEAIETLARATAGLIDGTERTADEVANGHVDYVRADQAAAANMPKMDGGH